jgi:NAD(P)-dependent dehydrogenase (short-subunit alcohol dehydrogenase family)
MRREHVAKSAREDAKSHAMCDHWLAERVFDWSGLTVAHLRDFRKTLESQTPLGRIGQTEDIAPGAVFFASSDSKWITGETLLIAGGLR